MADIPHDARLAPTHFTGRKCFPTRDRVSTVSRSTRSKQHTLNRSLFPTAYKRVILFDLEMKAHAGTA
jgi:hypothetical protein